MTIDDRWFHGHFDGAPILPGVAHIALAAEAAARPLRGVRDVRFKRPIVPGEAVEVILDGERFEIRANGEIASTGTLVFA